MSLASFVPPRPLGVIREEITDLLDYLNGLPEGVRQSGVFAPYEERLVDLQRELLSAELSELSEVVGLPGVPPVSALLQIIAMAATLPGVQDELKHLATIANPNQQTSIVLQVSEYIEKMVEELAPASAGAR